MTIRINQVTLLPEVMEKFSKVLSLTLTLSELTMETIHKLHHAAKQYKGKCLMRIRIQDPVENFTIDLPSKKYKVNPKDMINALTEMPEIQFRVFGEV